MNESSQYIIELIMQAQRGSKASMDALTKVVQGRLYTYIYRIVLKEDAAHDILQESLLEMLKVLVKLENAERFWPWIRSIAFSKINRYYSSLVRNKAVSIFSCPEGDLHKKRDREVEMGLSNLVSEELKQMIFNAVSRLKPQYRSVLVMRCYEDMEYAQIAELMEKSELGVRVLFYRAKKSLQRQLSNNGFRKSFLLSALVIFGKITTPTEAAAANVTVSAAATSTGFAGSLIAMASSKAAVIPFAAVMLAAGVITGQPYIDKAISWAKGETTAIKETITSALKTHESGAAAEVKEEHWFYYPGNANGPVMMRVKKYLQGGEESWCQLLENEQGNYYFNKAANTLYIENGRLLQGDLTVQRLPTDKKDLRGFLSKLDGKAVGIEYVAEQGDGLLVMSRPGQNCQPQITHNLNLLDEEYFRYDFPVGVKVVDKRDQMHKRGWTYFKISGQINGKAISGGGRVPFVYETSLHNPAWLSIQTADGVKIVDTVEGACIYDSGGRVSGCYQAGSFFKGLCRPWMGLHSLDTVRRDAAEQNLLFETSRTAGGNKAEVLITGEQIKMAYTIDLDRDIIEKITFREQNAERVMEGELNFEYLEAIEGVGDKFAEPRVKIDLKAEAYGPGILWLARLSGGSAGN